MSGLEVVTDSEQCGIKTDKVAARECGLLPAAIDGLQCIAQDVGID